jgi:hypothetical protein
MLGATIRLNKINEEFYGSAGVFDNGYCRRYYGGCPAPKCKTSCENYHRKHPTPSQFQKEYGYEYPDKNLVCFTYPEEGMDWSYGKWGEVREYRKHDNEVIAVCDCTPFPKPDANWRPE